MSDLCLAGGVLGLGGSGPEALPHVLSLLRLRHRLCADPLMQAETGAVTAEALLSTLFSGPDRGGFTQREETWRIEFKKTTQNEKKPAGLNVQGDALIPGGTDSLQREITQLVVSKWKPLRFTFLIEPPAAPTSRAGPKRPTAAVT